MMSKEDNDDILIGAINTLQDTVENLTKRVERLETDKRTMQQQINRLTQAHHHQNQSMY
jgi:prefoldin subunit 5